MEENEVEGEVMVMNPRRRCRAGRSMLHNFLLPFWEFYRSILFPLWPRGAVPLLYGILEIHGEYAGPVTKSPKIGILGVLLARN